MIGQQFLLYSPMLTNPQFSFCLFIAGRMLLTHTKYNGHGNGNGISAVPGALDTLIASLFEISGRWAGPREVDGGEKENLASVFAKRLVSARDNVSPMARGSLSLDIRQTVYSGTEDVAPPADVAGRHGLQGHGQPAITGTGTGTGMGMGITTRGPSGGPSHCINPPAASHSSHADPDLTTLQHPFDLTPDPSLTLAFPPLPLSFQHNFAPFADTDTDPFNLHLGPPGIRGQESSATASGWGAMTDTSPFYARVPVPVAVPEGYSTANGTMNGPTSGSPGSADTLSPGQRISRFGHGSVGGENAVGGLGS
jgi:hypothetical protein